MTKDTRRQRTKELIQNALVTLLEDSSFDKITTISIAREAGISRSSFYTHYKDKYEMVDHYQGVVFNTLEKIFDKNNYNLEDSILEILQYLNHEKLFASLLTENGTKEIHNFIRHKLQLMISQELQTHFHKKDEDSVTNEYHSVYLSHAIVGVFQMWVARGKKETPEQMTYLLTGLLNY